MTALMVLVLLICTLSLGTGGHKDHPDAGHTAPTVEVDPATSVDRSLACRYAEGPPLQRDLSTVSPSGPEATLLPP